MSKQLDQYVQSSIPEPYTILGVTLRPLSLGHLILMKKYGCAWAEDSERTSVSIFDLLIAIAICCRKYQEFIDWFANAEERNAWLNKWFKSIRLDCRRTENWSISNKMSLFNMYRKEGIVVPMYFNEDEDKSFDKESGAHWIQNVITLLVTEGRYTENEIYDIPLSKALVEYFKILENKGVITFMADWQIEQIDTAKKEKKLCPTEK
jgi:hypothetical protein